MSQHIIKNLDENKQLVAARKCKLKSFAILNPNSHDCYVKFYDAADIGSVTVGTTPTAWKLFLPKNTQWVDDRPDTSDEDGIWTFTNGIVIACTRDYLDSDTTAITTDCEIFLQERGIK